MSLSLTGSRWRASFFADIASRYARVITIEDGLIGTVESGLRGFAALAASQLYRSRVKLDHFGITDPGVAPSDHFVKVWEHYGMTTSALCQHPENKTGRRELFRTAANSNVKISNPHSRLSVRIRQSVPRSR